MKKQIQSLWFLSALVLFLGVGISLSAQTSTPPSRTPDAQSQPAQTPQAEPSQTQPAQTQQGAPSQTPEAQQNQTPDTQSQPSQTPQAPPSQAPDTTAPSNPNSQTTSGQASGAQSFTGTIVKSGDKYKFQDADSGNTYDIDHQDQVQKFEGKKVRVHGTLDPSTKMIHVQ